MAKLDTSDSKEYEIKVIWVSKIYIKESKDYLQLGVYYLVL